MRLNSIQEIKVYYQGKRDGVRDYAWWKDGLQYVGTTGKTLREAFIDLVYLEEDAKVAFSEGKVIDTV